MKITGVQYYWLIAIGLLVGLVYATVLAIVGPVETSDPMIVIPLLAILLYSGTAIMVVLLEIWGRFGLLVAILAVIVSPAIVIYWFCRIGGYDDRDSFAK